MFTISNQPTTYMEQTYTAEEKTPAALFWKANQPTPPLKEILKLTHIDETELARIVEKTQKKWLLSGERSMAADSPELKAIQTALLQHAEKLQMRRTIEPKNKVFSSVLILGAKIAPFEKRLKSALDRIGSREISIDSLCILSGERKLDQDEIDALKAMGCQALDEREMMEFIANKRIAEYRKEQHKCPPDFTVYIIKAPKKEGAARATAEDTLKAWQQADKSCSKAPLLVVSSQPYGYYQLLITQASLLNKTLDLLAVETSESRAVIYLDTLARILFTIDKNK